MSIFEKHTEASAPESSGEVLAKVKARYGFIPNLAAYVAESPVALEAVLGLVTAFDKVSLTPQEQQVVLLTVSTLNGCLYCKTVHTALAQSSSVDRAVIDAVIALEQLPDPRLDALSRFTRKVVDERGWVAEQDVQRFLDAGYTKAQVFEVVMGVALKTLTNYSNHLAGATPNPEFVAMAERSLAA